MHDVVEKVLVSEEDIVKRSMELENKSVMITAKQEGTAAGSLTEGKCSLQS